MGFLTSWRIKHRQQFFAPLLPSDALCFDIGANHGEYTAAFLSLGARCVVAVEPQPEVAQFIVEAFPNEILNGNLIVRAQAVGSEKGVAKLFPAPDAGKSMSTLSTAFVEISRASGGRWDDAAAIEVNVVTLNSLIDEFGTPDYVKIDVEGFDLEVLQGLSRSIDLLSFEFNSQPGLIEVAEQCIERIDRLGRYEFNYQAETSGQTSLQFDKWVSAGVMQYTLRHDIARSRLFGDIFARCRSELSADTSSEASEHKEKARGEKRHDLGAALNDKKRLQSKMEPLAGETTDRHEPVGVVAEVTNQLNFGAIFQEMAPFLGAADSPEDRRRLSREFDTRIVAFLRSGDHAALPRIQCFYEVMSEMPRHDSLIAATTSMQAMGHPVRVWSYTPQKLDFLRPLGIELRAADEVVPIALFDQIVAGSEIRYFSDIFRYAALYEHGGLWMDSDVVLLRPFPFCGDYFLNLQWRHGGRHFICGNVIYAEPYSLHFRNLYETALDRFFGSDCRAFGAVGPELLSEYVASEIGAELRNWVFSPMFFNSIDWTEIDKFNQAIDGVAEYLNDERVFGIHLWTLRNVPRAGSDSGSLISLLSDPLTGLPNLMRLADRFNTDKNSHTGNRHYYARIYQRLLSPRRFSLRRLMEIGLCVPAERAEQTEIPSVNLWQTYFPFCTVIGVDLTDFSAMNNNRFTSFVCDQSKRDDLRSVAAKLEPGSIDVIIDDGSHASFDQQLTLREFFPLLADGGWYFIEDLDWQPSSEDAGKITLTKNLLREIQQHGVARSTDPLSVSELAEQIAEILFFDSHFELIRAKLVGGLVAIRKRGGTDLVR